MLLIGTGNRQNGLPRSVPGCPILTQNGPEFDLKSGVAYLRMGNPTLNPDQMEMDEPQFDLPIRPDEDAGLEWLKSELSKGSSQLTSSKDWPRHQLELFGRLGVFGWFSDPAWGGTGRSAEEICQGYVNLASSCLTTTFILTQRQGASRRIEDSGNVELAAELLPGMNSGELFATVAISHLTTSRRHLKTPVLRATQHGEGFLLEGFSPWVTGAPSADWIVAGATMTDKREILVAVDTTSPGVNVGDPADLVAVSASQTGAVNFDQVEVPKSRLLAGPSENVMSSGVGGNTGGIPTSALATGLSLAAVEFIQSEASNRHDLVPVAEALGQQWQQTFDLLLEVANDPLLAKRDELRTQANSLVLRSTQAALSAAKGAGYMAEHHVGRWCREALFFLVWSCPQGVAQANLCELAGIVE